MCVRARILYIHIYATVTIEFEPRERKKGESDTSINEQNSVYILSRNVIYVGYLQCLHNRVNGFSFFENVFRSAVI